MVARRQPRERKVESPERVMSREHPFQNEFREEERGAERPGFEPRAAGSVTSQYPTGAQVDCGMQSVFAGRIEARQRRAATAREPAPAKNGCTHQHRN